MISQNEPSNIIVAIDPGREKCGVAVVREDGRILYQEVVATREINRSITLLMEKYPKATLVMGDRTFARHLRKQLTTVTKTDIHAVDEHHSTIQGRRRYFKENPPRGWRRLLPISLQMPPKPYDDYVAVILAERYLESLRAGQD